MLRKGQVEGRSLLPLLNDAKKTLPDNRYLFTHKGRWATGSNPDEFKWKNFAVRSQRWRYIGGQVPRNGAKVPGALFDMEKNPSQTKNVANEHPDVVKTMRYEYEKFWQETRPLMENEGVPMSKTRPFHVNYKNQIQTDGIMQWKMPEF